MRSLKVEPADDEMLATAKVRLGAEYGTYFYHCIQEFWRVQANWDRYEALFSTKMRVDVLNSSSGSFWNAVQDMLFHHVILGICRLTDPPRVRGKRNLTIMAFDELDNSRSKRRLQQRLETVRKRSEFARSWRHKRIAHSDLAHVLGTEQLDRATRRRTTLALTAIHQVFSWIEARHFNSTLRLHELGDGDAMAVLMTLRDGQALRKLRAEEYIAGRFDPRLETERGLFDGDGRSTRYRDQDRLRPPRPRKHS